MLKNKSGSDEPGNQPWPDIVVLFCSYHGFASQGASKKTVEVQTLSWNNLGLIGI